MQAAPLLSVQCLPCSCYRLSFQVRLWLRPLRLCLSGLLVPAYLHLGHLILWPKRLISTELPAGFGQWEVAGEISEGKRPGGWPHYFLGTLSLLLPLAPSAPSCPFLPLLAPSSHIGIGSILLQKAKTPARWPSPTAVNFSRFCNCLLPLPLHVWTASCHW